MGICFMRSIAFIIALAACLTQAAAQIIIPTEMYGLIITNQLVNGSSMTATNVAFTNTQSTLFGTYHSFQFFYVPIGTNSTTFALDRTLDNANWINVATNTWTGTNSFETNYVGKWIAYRVRIGVTSTNIPTLTGNYMGQ
jgi:hypothetical protein